MLVPTAVIQAGTQIAFDETLSVDGVSIDTGATITPAYRHLLVAIYARTSDAVFNSSAVLRFNGDSSAIYDYCRMRNDNTTFTGTSDVAQTGLVFRCPGDSVAAGSFGTTSVFIASYAQTTGQKSVEGTGGVLDASAANCSVVALSGRWRNTAAITRISITAGGGSFRAGTRLTVYGI